MLRGQRPCRIAAAIRGIVGDEEFDDGFGCCAVGGESLRCLGPREKRRSGKRADEEQWTGRDNSAAWG